MFDQHFLLCFSSPTQTLKKLHSLLKILSLKLTLSSLFEEKRWKMWENSLEGELITWPNYMLKPSDENLFGNPIRYAFKWSQLGLAQNLPRFTILLDQKAISYVQEIQINLPLSSVSTKLHWDDPRILF